MDYVSIEIILIIIVIFVAVFLIYKQNKNMNLKRLERFTEHTPSLSMYYTNWCGHSRRMLPVFNGTEAVFLGRVEFIKHDCEDRTGDGRQQCSDNKVRFLPTILFRKTPTSDPVKYTGGPDTSTLSNFVETELAK